MNKSLIFICLMVFSILIFGLFLANYMVSTFGLKWKEIASVLGGLTSISGIFGLIFKFYLDWNLEKSKIKFKYSFDNKIKVFEKICI